MKTKLGIVGCGFLGNIVADAWKKGLLPDYELVGVTSRTRASAEKTAANVGCAVCEDVDALLALEPEYIVEAASVESVRAMAIPVLKRGVNLVILSIGAFADLDFYAQVKAAAVEGGAKVHLASGAIGGFDVLQTVTLMAQAQGLPETAGIETHTGAKGFRNTPVWAEHLLTDNEKTTVFSWQELSENLFTTTPDSFDSHTALEELQTDRNPTLYLFSAAAVFLAYVFHLGFVPALMLGRTANLIVFALLAALAVKAAPFGRRVFAAAALLPMTLHLAASFSRDSLLLGLAFAFTALCMQAIFGCKDGTVLPVRLWLPLAVFGILLAPAKLVYLPLAALFLLIPNSRFGQSAATKKAAYLAGCVLLALSINRAVLVTSVAGSAGFENQTTQAETTSAQGSTPAAAVSYTATEAADNRTLHAAPAAGDGKTANRFANMPAEYRENTASNFVRRLYYLSLIHI